MSPEEQDFVEFYSQFVPRRITELRMAKGVSEREMSLSLGRAGTYINHIVTGKARPKLPSFFEICEYLEVTPEEFFSDEPNPLILNEIRACIAQLDEFHAQKMLDFFKSISASEMQELIDILDKRPKV